MNNHTLVRDSNGIPLGAEVCIRIPRGMRKRCKFLLALGREPEYLYSFHFDGNFTYVTADEYERIKLLVTRARVDFDKLLKCWS